jgi:hypothetical protein
MKSLRRCEHNRRWANCRECGGSNICVHKRIKQSCVECGGAAICEHKKQKATCMECKGSQTCEHKAVRKLCMVCSPLTWARELIRANRKHARKNGYAGMAASPEDVVKLLQNATNCVLCDEPLDWTETPHLHHSHKTGEIKGFAHGFCNLTEGRLMKLALKSRLHFLGHLMNESESAE